MKLIIKIALGIILAFILLFVGCVGCMSYGAYKVGQNLENSGVVEKGEITGEPLPENYVTNEEIFAKVQKGMTKQQVLDIAKREPTKKQQMESAGLSMECWYYSLSIQICFDGNEVSSKASY